MANLKLHNTTKQTIIAMGGGHVDVAGMIGEFYANTRINRPTSRQRTTRA